MKILWWSLNNREKANRSFFIAPFCLLLFFIDTLNLIFGYALPLICCSLFVLQGLFYRWRANKESV